MGVDNMLAKLVLKLSHVGWWKKMLIARWFVIFNIQRENSDP
jgi:hypothetical protein